MRSGGFRNLARDQQGLTRIVDGLAQEHAQTRGGLNMVASIILGRGFWGRLKWLLMGSGFKAAPKS